MSVHVLCCTLELNVIIVPVQLFEYSFKWGLDRFIISYITFSKDFFFFNIVITYYIIGKMLLGYCLYYK